MSAQILYIKPWGAAAAVDPSHRQDLVDRLLKAADRAQNPHFRLVLKAKARQAGYLPSFELSGRPQARSLSIPDVPDRPRFRWPF